MVGGELMHQMYALSAKGTVKVWVDTEKELITLKETLKVGCCNPWGGDHGGWGI